MAVPISRVEIRILYVRKVDENDQATKSIRRMPRYMAPRKDVTSCEKLRGAANELRSADVRMRERSTGNAVLSFTESIGK